MSEANLASLPIEMWQCVLNFLPVDSAFSLRTVCKAWADAVPKSRETLGQLDFLNMLPQDPARRSWNDPTRQSLSAQGFLMRALPTLRNLRTIACHPKDSAHWACLTASTKPLFDEIFPKLTRLQALKYPFVLLFKSKYGHPADTLVATGMGKLTLLEDLSTYRPLQRPLSLEIVSKFALLKELRVLSFETLPAPPLDQVLPALEPLKKLEEFKIWRDATVSHLHLDFLRETFPKLRLLTLSRIRSPFRVLDPTHITQGKLKDLIESRSWFCDVRFIGEAHSELFPELSLLELVAAESPNVLAFACEQMKEMSRLQDALLSTRGRRKFELSLVLTLLYCDKIKSDYLITKNPWTASLIRTTLSQWSFLESEMEEDKFIRLITEPAAATARFSQAVDGMAQSVFISGKDSFLNLLASVCATERTSCPAESIPALELRVKRAAVAMARNGINSSELANYLSAQNLTDFYIECMHVGAESQNFNSLQLGVSGLTSIGANVSQLVNTPKGSDGLVPLQRIFAPCKRREPGAPVLFSRQAVELLVSAGASCGVTTFDGWNIIDLAVLTRTDDRDTELSRLAALAPVLKQAASLKDKSTVEALANPGRRSIHQTTRLFDEMGFYAHPSLVDAVKLFSDSVWQAYGSPLKFVELMCHPRCQSDPFCSAAQDFVGACLKAQAAVLTASQKAVIVQKACQTGLVQLLDIVVRGANVNLPNLDGNLTWGTVIQFYGAKVPRAVNDGLKLQQKVEIVGQAVSEYLASRVAPDSKLLERAISSCPHEDLIRTMCSASTLPPGILNTEEISTAVFDGRETIKVPLLYASIACGNPASVRATASLMNPAWTTQKGLSLLHICPHGGIAEIFLQQFPKFDVNTKDPRGRSVIEFWASNPDQNTVTGLVTSLLNNSGDRVIDFGAQGRLFQFIPANPNVFDALRRYLIRLNDSQDTIQLLEDAIYCNASWKPAQVLISSIAELSRLNKLGAWTPTNWTAVLDALISGRHAALLRTLLQVPAVAAAASSPMPFKNAKEPLTALSFVCSHDISVPESLEFVKMLATPSSCEWKDAQGRTAADYIQTISKDKISPQAQLVLEVLRNPPKQQSGPTQQSGKHGTMKVDTATPVWKPVDNPFADSKTANSTFSSPAQLLPTSFGSSQAAFAGPVSQPSTFGTFSSPSSVTNPFASTPSSSPFSAAPTNPFSSPLSANPSPK